MAKYSIPVLLLSLSILLIASGVESRHRCSKARAFNKIVCNNTRYPKVCEQTLLSYINSTNQSHQQLAQIALRVSLARARFARAYLAKLASKLKGHGPDYLAIGSCIDQINDSVAQLRESLFEIQRLSEDGSVDDFMWHTSNIETWTSAALTYQTTCVEAFSDAGRGKSIKAVVKGKVTDVAQVTSNALALVNRFVTRHRFARGVHRP